MSSSEIQSKEKTPDILVSIMAVFFGFAAGWAYQFSGKMMYSNMLGLSLPRLLVLIAGTGAIIYLLWKHFDFVYELFASVHFAAILGLALALATILGTLVKQEVQPQEYIQTYGVTGTRLIKNLYLDNVFYSHWFLLLMGFMVMGLVAVTIKRKQFTPEKWGFLFAHAGVVILLVGGWIGMTQGREGMMDLRQGEAKNAFYDMKKHNPINLDFQVQLKKFIIDYYPTEYRFDVFKFGEKYNQKKAHAKGKDKKGHEDVKRILSFKSDELKKEALRALGKSKYKLKLLRFYPHLGWKEKTTPVPDDTPIDKKGKIVRVVSMEWKWDGKKERKEFIPRDPWDPRRLYHSFGDHKMFLFVSDQKMDKNFEKDYPSGKIPASHQLMLSEIHTKEHGSKDHKHASKKVSVSPGKELSFQGVKVQVLRYLPDFTMDLKTRKATTRSMVPQNPALQIMVSKKGTNASIWIFAAQPSGHGMQILEKMGINIKYVFQPEIQGFERYIFLLLTTQEIVEIQDRKIVHRAPLTKGFQVKDYGFEITDLKISKMMREFERANVSEKDVNPAAEVAILEGDKVVAKEWLSPRAGGSLFSPDKKFAIQMQKDRPIKTYKSSLAIIEKGKVVMEKDIVVNDPLWYKGYAFYQSGHDGTIVSSLRVVLDPGLFLALLGMFLASLGVPYIFYVQPVLKTRKKRALQQKLSATKGN